MKSRTLTCITALMLFTALAIPLRLAAQEQQQNKQQPRYKLIDLGTFGGPNSFVPELQQIINSRGTVVGGADTPIPDPYSPNCFDPECFVQHTLQWQNGVVTDLGALPGVNSSTPAQVNARGWVAGVSQNGEIDPLVPGFPEQRAVLWRDGEIIDLGTLGGNESGGIGMNNRGQVIGLATNAIPDPFSFFYFFSFGSSRGTQTRAFLSQEGQMQDLGTLGGNDAFGQYNNDRGQVAGFSYTNSTPNPTTGFPTVDAFLWENGTMIDLGSFGGTFGQVNNLNNRGQVVGTSNLSGDIFTHGFLWDRGVLTDVGTFGGDNGEAEWLNEAGEIAGSADFPGDQIHHAFLWKKGALTDLGTVDGDLCSRGRGINSKGQIVGGSSDCHTFLHAFLWENGGPAIDLNSLVAPGSGLTLTLALFVNDRGEIAGNGVLSNGDSHAFLLIPCGEGDDGCQAESPIGVTQTSPAPATQQPTTATPANPALSDRPSGMLDRLRSRWGQRYHLAGSGTGPTN